MKAQWTPMKWPSSWKDPALLERLSGTPINFLLLTKDAGLEAVARRAQALHLETAETAPAAVKMLDGAWPGVKLNAAGAVDMVAAGPTAEPWVDSNGWRIQLSAALEPGKQVWIEAAPKTPFTSDAYRIAIADAAIHQGRWIIQLDERLAAGVAAGEAEAFATWKAMTGAAAFFAAHERWAECEPAAVLGVLSDFSGDNRKFGEAVVGVADRYSQPCRLLVKGAAASLHGLRSVLYADAQAPVAAVRAQALEFVQRGGLLIAGPAWGALPAGAQASDAVRGHAVFTWGKGKIALKKTDMADPYLALTDAALLLSHRYDGLKIFNAGAVSALYTRRPAGDGAVVQVLFHAPPRGGNPRTVVVAGPHRSARLWTLDGDGARELETVRRTSGLECHLPAVGPYAAVELEA